MTTDTSKLRILLLTLGMLRILLREPLSQGYYVGVLRIPVEIPVSRKVYKCVYTQSKKCVYR